MTQTKGKILVVEDEHDIRELLKFNLVGRGFDVTDCANGEEGLLAIKEKQFDLLILDWMLPGVSGVQVAKVARAMENGKSLAILMLTAKSEPENIVEGLDAGADDYMVKPFDNSVLWARVQALMRRSQRLNLEKKVVDAQTTTDLLTLGTVQLSLKTYEVRVDNQLIDLTPSEFKLLSTMLAHKGRVLTRERLISEVQGEGVSVVGRTVDTHVFGLRKKLGAAGDLIETIRGVGYRVKEEA
jgi:two-component system, OmpR family, phosphate regulon response regulator PhoB